MSIAATAQGTRVDQFFTAAEARFDRWRTLLDAARAWEAGKEKDSSSTFAALQELKQWEDYFAYPGPILMRSLEESIASGDLRRTVRLVQLIHVALLTHSYRSNPAEWDGEEQPVRLGEGLPGGDDAAAHRPYFEVLVVTPLRRDAWPEMAQEYKKLRRPQDRFIYELVFVGSFEDAVLASIVNGNIESVIASDGVPFASSHDAPVLREFLLANLPSHAFSTRSGEQTLELARALKQIRPELDIFLLSGSEVEKIAGDATAAEYIRRIFYQVEEPLELHLSILDAIADRFETPYFDNLQKYAQRPMGTFHALPVARGKSIFKSNWIRDMGRFYGMNLFLAESSATTGGLDSLLEPTGNVKVAQEKAARAFGADHVFFVTNGTSTSNKMVEQALLGPDDIMLVDRNCHKSHHYGAVLSGALPLYLEAYPLRKFSMYGAVPLASIKQALLELKAEGKLDRARLLVLTNCTFDGHIYNVERVMEECLAIKPDLIFLWDEAWFGFARWTPFYRRRTAMGAAAILERKFKDPAYHRAYEEQKKKLGDNLDLSNPEVLKTRLLADPDKVRLRVYQTNSTHKSMSCLRQGSMVLVKDQDYHTVEEQFHEAVFTHASTSPNLQIIASIDVARRQMELEGYELVNRAIQLALDVRREVNSHPLVSKYFHVAGADEMIPEEFRASGFVDYLVPGTNWSTSLKCLRDDEVALDVTRLTLVCGSAGFDGTQFKNILAADYDIQLNKTSRNSVLLQTNINNTRSDIAHLIKVLVGISQQIDVKLQRGGKQAQQAFAARVKSLMEDVPDLPNFTSFHNTFRQNPASTTSEGDMRSAFFGAYREEQCEHVKLSSAEIDRRLKEGPELVSANFVIPYPPGFPIMVPGQVINRETIEFMRKLDVKEIHGFAAALGLKLLTPAYLEAAGGRGKGIEQPKRVARSSAA
ncbi:MAG: decarboxylase [Acidobacteria bacterium]|nr:MAG: decarboxylase [Acidobacteriota bacterium]PYY01299.1 MAG: decarboxylase [Acidobacteriota bacterium]PYY23910.1 MAG: decarboxylase [Acidobacteriota bacterium]